MVLDLIFLVVFSGLSHASLILLNQKIVFFCDQKNVADNELMPTLSVEPLKLKCYKGLQISLHKKELKTVKAPTARYT